MPLDEHLCKGKERGVDYGSCRKLCQEVKCPNTGGSSGSKFDSVIEEAGHRLTTAPSFSVPRNRNSEDHCWLW